MSRFASHIWRTYDIRGRTPDEITVPLAERLGLALGALVRGRGARTIAVARDAREDGAVLQEALCDGLARAGVQVAHIGMVPTPVMYFTESALDYDAGIIVTASHNPRGYNGFKTRLHGAALFGADILALQQQVEDDALPTTAAAPGGSIARVDVRPDYIAHIAARYRPPAGRRLRVVVDAGNGATGPIAVRLLSSLGAEVVPLFCDPDGRFPNHPANPTVAENLLDLRDAVLDTGADLGVAFDGDGDRFGAVSRAGELVFGDRLLAVFAEQVLRDAGGSGAIIADVKCSMALGEAVQRAGGTFVLSQTGYPWIQKEMRARSAPLGGELSGHICFADRYFGFDDGLYAATRLMELAADLDARLQALPHYPAIPEHRLHTAEADKWQVPGALLARLQAAGRYDLLTVDGVRFSTPSGWGLVRVSNTEPCLTVRAEAHTEAELARLLAEMIAALEAMPVHIDLAPLRGEAGRLRPA